MDFRPETEKQPELLTCLASSHFVVHSNFRESSNAVVAVAVGWGSPERDERDPDERARACSGVMDDWPHETKLYSFSTAALQAGAGSDACPSRIKRAAGSALLILNYCFAARSGRPGGVLRACLSKAAALTYCHGSPYVHG